MDLSQVKLHIVQSTGGHYLTEDAGWGGVYEHHAVLVAADGAPLHGMCSGLLCFCSG